MIDTFWIAFGMIGAAYFIGKGLKNFKNPDPITSHNNSDFTELDNTNFWGAPELIREDKVSSYIGISKDDAKSLVKDCPDVPHVIINNQVYFPANKLKKWINEISETK